VQAGRVRLAVAKQCCSRFCSCRFPPASTGIHRFQQGGRISLKRKHLKIEDFDRRPETALGSVDPPNSCSLFSTTCKEGLLNLVDSLATILHKSAGRPDVGVLKPLIR